MRPASVGFHCPDDVAAGQCVGAARRSTPSAGPAERRQPIVTWTPGRAERDRVRARRASRWAACPSSPEPVRAGLRRSADARVPDEPWRLLTGAFLHDGILHIALNMAALVLLGQQLEQVLGRVRYLALYVVCGVGRRRVGLPVRRHNTSRLGPAAAIFGLFSAFYLVAKRLRVDASGILVTIGINLVLTFLIPNISLWGHLGGLVTGAVVGLVYTQAPVPTGAVEGSAARGRGGGGRPSGGRRRGPFQHSQLRRPDQPGPAGPVPGDQPAAYASFRSSTATSAGSDPSRCRESSTSRSPRSISSELRRSDPSSAWTWLRCARSPPTPPRRSDRNPVLSPMPSAPAVSGTPCQTSRPASTASSPATTTSPGPAPLTEGVVGRDGGDQGRDDRTRGVGAASPRRGTPGRIGYRHRAPSSSRPTPGAAACRVGVTSPASRTPAGEIRPSRRRLRLPMPGEQDTPCQTRTGDYPHCG